MNSTSVSILVLFFFYQHFSVTSAHNEEPKIDYGFDVGRFVEELLVGAANSAGKLLLGPDVFLPLEKEITFWSISPKGTQFTQLFVSDPNEKFVQYLDATKPTGLLIHGYLSSFRGGFLYDFTLENSWMEYIAIDWSYYKDINIVCVDWSRYANFLLTDTATFLPLVTDYVTKFVSRLVDSGFAIESMQIAGHSFGAVIAGSVGTNFHGKMNTVFGLDPANDILYVPFTGNQVSINTSSAQYVQIIHTNALLFGSGKIEGHADIFVNGGTLQPACSVLSFLNPNSFTPLPIVCDHLAAIAYFAISCNPTRIFDAVSSNSVNLLIDVVEPVEELVAGLFGAKTSKPQPNPPNVHERLGPFNNRVHGKFQLTTTGTYPYCLGCR